MVAAAETLDFGLIGEKLRDGIECAVNLLDRSFPPGMSVHGLQPLLLLTTRHVQAVYRTIVNLCADRQENEQYRFDYVVGALPLTRNLADAVATVAFVLSDPEPYTRWYWASGWREYAANVARYRRRARPEEAAWLAQQEQELQRSVAGWHLPPSWVADPKRHIPWWPNLSRLARDCLHRDEREFFSLLDAWFYKVMSSAAHATAPGLRQGALLLLLDDDDHREAQLEALRSTVAITAITLTLAYLSELRGRLGLNIFHLPFVWTAVLPVSMPARELYDLRYQALLTEPA